MPATTPDEIVRRRPFAGVVDLVSAETLQGPGAKSGSAFVVRAADGRAYKLRVCRWRSRAHFLARYIRLLPEVFPALVAHEGRYLLLEYLSDYRPLERFELIRRAATIGEKAATIHARSEASTWAGRQRRALVARTTWRRLVRDLRSIERVGLLSPAEARGAMAKARARAPLGGVDVALELDDVHKQNFLICDETGDLRYIDEEGVGLRLRGMGLASFVKTMTKARTLGAYREGYARAGDARFLDDGYLEFLVIVDVAGRVARKARTGVESEKLEQAREGLRAIASTPELCLDWCFRRETMAEFEAIRSARVEEAAPAEEAAERQSALKP